MISNFIFDIFSFSSSPGQRYLYILIMSLLSALLFLFLFKKTSNQQKIALHKKKIWGNILQIRLYQDRFSLLLLSVFSILKHNLFYLHQMLIPLVVMLLPLLIFTVQINNRCGYEPLQENQQFLIQAQLDVQAAPDASLLEHISCETSSHIKLETPPFRIESEGKTFWRARVIAPPNWEIPSLRIGLQGKNVVTERIVALDYLQERFTPEKKKWSLWNELLYNGEGFFEEKELFESISIGYNRASYRLLFWNVDAIVLYFIFTLVMAFGLKGVMGVDI